MLRQLYVVIIGISMILLLPIGGRGQTTSGSIIGAVTDQSGGVVPGAHVQVINEGTGAVRTMDTTSAGVFNVPDLDLGTYRVRVSAKGFTTFERTGLILAANQIIDVPVQLAVGATATVVEVTGASPVISTETNDISSSIQNQALNDLPLVARHGGASGMWGYVVFNTGTNNQTGSGQPVIGGARLQTGAIPTMDGIAVMAYIQGASPVQPSLQDIQEVKIETSAAPAEFATPGNIQVVTKGGTNEFHGGAFENYNGDDLNARNFFSKTVPFRVYNNFGAKLGGPIKKNKVFFWGDYEGSREAATDTIVESVPLPAWRTGNFGSRLNTNVVTGTDPCGQTIYQGAITNPLTGCVFPSNQIPSGDISQVSQNIQSYGYPLPNTGAAGTITNNWIQNFPGQTGFTVFDMVDTRVDYNLGNRDTIFWRGSWRKLRLDTPGLYPMYLPQQRYGESTVLAWSHNLSASAINEFRMGATYNRNHYASNLNGSALLSQFGIKGVQTSGVLTGPDFAISGVTAWNPDTDSDNQEDNPEPTLEVLDNFSWTRGRHFMKFGFDAIDDRYGGNNLTSVVYGQYSFTGLYSGFGYADFLLGIPQTVKLAVPTPNRHIRGTNYGMFGQDQFRVGSRLTLNYGIRWEFFPPYTDRDGTIYTFDPATGGLVIPNNGTVNPFFPTNIPVETASKAAYPANPTSLFNMKYNNIKPRFGFAYKLFGGDKTVVRGGYGIYSNLVYQQLTRAMEGGPHSGSVTYNNSKPPAGTSPATPFTPAFQFPSPFLSSGTTATQSVSGWNPNMKVPYTATWNLSLEHQIGQWGLRISYKGARSTQLIYLRNINNPAPSTTPFGTDSQVYYYPLYNSVTYADNGGNDFYSALETAAQKRYGKNFIFNAGYTWCKGLTDTQDSGAGGGNYAGQVIQNQFNRAVEKGNDGIDLPQRFYAYGLYTLPVGQGERLLSNAHGPLQQILGGWRATFTVIAQSGWWFQPSFSSLDPSNANPTGGGLPDRIGNGNLPSGQRSIQNWFNAAAFKIPGCPDTTPVCTASQEADVGRFGNAGYNILSDPRLFNLDFGLMKDFRISERVRLAFTMTMADAFNHPNFSTPDANISDGPGVTGVISGQVAGATGETNDREIDFGLRLEF